MSPQAIPKNSLVPGASYEPGSPLWWWELDVVIGSLLPMLGFFRPPVGLGLFGGAGSGKSCVLRMIREVLQPPPGMAPGAAQTLALCERYRADAKLWGQPVRLEMKALEVEQELEGRARSHSGEEYAVPRFSPILIRAETVFEFRAERRTNSETLEGSAPLLLVDGLEDLDPVEAYRVLLDLADLLSPPAADATNHRDQEPCYLFLAADLDRLLTLLAPRFGGDRTAADDFIARVVAQRYFLPKPPGTTAIDTFWPNAENPSPPGGNQGPSTESDGGLPKDFLRLFCAHQKGGNLRRQRQLAVVLHMTTELQSKAAFNAVLSARPSSKDNTEEFRIVSILCQIALAFVVAFRERSPGVYFEWVDKPEEFENLHAMLQQLCLWKRARAGLESRREERLPALASQLRREGLVVTATALESGDIERVFNPLFEELGDTLGALPQRPFGLPDLEEVFEGDAWGVFSSFVREVFSR